MNNSDFREAVYNLALADLPDAEIATQLDVGVQVVRETLNELVTESIKRANNRRINPVLRLGKP